MSSAQPALLVHATNVTGLGASQVTESLLRALCPHLSRPACVYLPDRGPLRNFDGCAGAERVIFRRTLPNGISRLLECLEPQLYFPQSRQTLVLGDIPLRGRKNQIVFVQQAHLLDPAVEPRVGQSATFRLSRAIFKRNLAHVSKVIVQTNVMKELMTRSYPAAANRIALLRHPAPAITGHARDRVGTERADLSLLFPAAGFPHKNHDILQRMHAVAGAMSPAPTIIVTLRENELPWVNAIGWVRNVGRLSPSDIHALYATVDGLFFPSLLESFPLPLPEAMALGLAVVCADLPYAREICGSEAIYFDPASGSDAWRALHELKDRLERGWRPDWREALSKLAQSWDETARALLSMLDQR